MRARTVTGAGGVRLHVVEAGPQAAPSLLLLHGFCQSHDAWRPLLTGALADSFRLIAPDLRGHGRSDKPAEPEAYDSGRPWADDVAALIAALGLDRPILAGWSYGALVAMDYVRHHGTGGLSGLHLVAAMPGIGTDRTRPLLGPVATAHMPGMLSADTARNDAATRAFLAAWTASPLPARRTDAALAAAAATPLPVRRAMMGRREDDDALLAGLDLPVFIAHGTEDGVVLPAAAHHLAAIVPRQALSLYQGIGHLPFAEAPDRFAREAAIFAHRVAASSRAA